MSNAATPTTQQVAEAIDWLVKFETGGISHSERIAFERWQLQSPEHQLAWQRVGRSASSFAPVANLKNAQLSSAQVLCSLDAAEQRLRDKRRSMKTLASIGGLGAAVWLSRDYTGAASAGRYLYGQTLADITTAPGEQKSLVLGDGATLLINTRSALSIDFNAQPQLVLHYGELSITQSGGAQIRAGNNVFNPAPGAEFTVIRQGDFCRVQVVSGQVNCLLEGEGEHLLESGQKLKREGNRVMRGVVASHHRLSWREGFISAERTRLDQFVAQVGRYRSGYVGCAAPVSNLTLSGSFPIADTDLILDNLCQILPVRQQRLSRYWVRLLPA